MAKLCTEEDLRVSPRRRLVRRKGPTWLVAKEASRPSFVIALGKPACLDTMTRARHDNKTVVLTNSKIKFTFTKPP